MPDDTAARTRRRALAQALYRKLYGAELLIATHDLDQFALVRLRENRERADDVEQVLPIQHAGHQSLLVVRATVTMSQILHRTWPWVGPAVEMLFDMRSDGAELSLIAAGGHHKLIE